ncbi:BEN domain-containing protein 2, partial [Galemys pyrenaicus]
TFRAEVRVISVTGLLSTKRSGKNAGPAEAGDWRPGVLAARLPGERGAQCSAADSSGRMEPRPWSTHARHECAVAETTPCSVSLASRLAPQCTADASCAWSQSQRSRADAQSRAPSFTMSEEQAHGVLEAQGDPGWCPSSPSVRFVLFQELEVNLGLVASPPPLQRMVFQELEVIMGCVMPHPHSRAHGVPGVHVILEFSSAARPHGFAGCDHGSALGLTVWQGLESITAARGDCGASPPTSSWCSQGSWRLGTRKFPRRLAFQDLEVTRRYQSAIVRKGCTGFEGRLVFPGPLAWGMLRRAGFAAHVASRPPEVRAASARRCQDYIIITIEDSDTNDDDDDDDDVVLIEESEAENSDDEVSSDDIPAIQLDFQNGHDNYPHPTQIYGASGLPLLDHQAASHMSHLENLKRFSPISEEGDFTPSYKRGRSSSPRENNMGDCSPPFLVERQENYNWTNPMGAPQPLVCPELQRPLLRESPPLPRVVSTHSLQSCLPANNPFPGSLPYFVNEGAENTSSVISSAQASVAMSTALRSQEEPTLANASEMMTHSTFLGNSNMNQDTGSSPLCVLPNFETPRNSETSLENSTKAVCYRTVMMNSCGQGQDIASLPVYVLSNFGASESNLENNPRAMNYPNVPGNESEQHSSSIPASVPSNFVYLGDPRRNVSILDTHLMIAQKKTKPRLAASYLVRVLFSTEVLICSSVGGYRYGETPLDPNKIAAIREYLTAVFPNHDLRECGKDWKACISDIGALISCLCSDAKRILQLLFARLAKTTSPPRSSKSWHLEGESTRVFFFCHGAPSFQASATSPDSCFPTNLGWVKTAEDNKEPNGKRDGGASSSQWSQSAAASGMRDSGNFQPHSSAFPEGSEEPSSDNSAVEYEALDYFGKRFRNILLPCSVMKIAKGKSRPELSARYLIRKLFPEDVLLKSNVYGNVEHGMCALSPNRISALREFLQDIYPSCDLSEGGCDWKLCVTAINSCIRSLRYDFKRSMSRSQPFPAAAASTEPKPRDDDSTDRSI